MQKEEQIRVIEDLLNHLDKGTNVDAGRQLRNPVASYTSQEIARKEWDSFFQDFPHAMGLSSELPSNGSFFTTDDLGKPILCTRDNGGQFNAFLNVCRHRGAQVESERRGERNLFSCPFHAWGYNNRGDLVAVPKEDHFGQVDKACRGLVRLPAEEKHGILWINPNPAGELRIDEHLQDLGEELASWDLEKFAFNGETTYEHPMNWKLAIDTFGETYHFNVLHKDTLANDFYGNVQTYDTYGRNHRMMLCLKNIDKLRNTPKEMWHVLLGALPVYYIFPNVQLILGMGGPTLVRVYPDGENPHQSTSKISFYLNPELSSLDLNEEQKARYESVQERMQGFAEVIEQEDYVAAAGSHRGILSGAQDHFIFGRNEPALHHYHNTYRAALGMPPLEAVQDGEST
jgi:phenylpropionate dioxygenase-like ring-hydroxylating dioxygenase large terminal subunit